MQDPKPILVTGYTRGLYAEIHKLTGPIWDEWCLLHDYDYRPIAFTARDRQQAVTSKYAAMLPHLKRGHPVLWADVDGLPVLKSPDPAKGTSAKRPFAAILVPRGRPKTGHVLTGLLYTRPEAIPILEEAIRLQHTRRYHSICQRALATALQGLPKIETPEAPPTSAMPIVGLDRAWFRHTNSKLKPSDKAYLWHATFRRHLRIPRLKAWIAEGRHVHPPSQPLPLAWRKAPDLTPTKHQIYRGRR